MDRKGRVFEEDDIAEDVASELMEVEEGAAASSMSSLVGLRLANQDRVHSPEIPVSPVKRSPRGVKAKVKSVQKAVMGKIKKARGLSRSSRNRNRERAFAMYDDMERRLDHVQEERMGNLVTEASDEAAGLGTSTGSQIHHATSVPTDVVMEEDQGSSTTASKCGRTDRARKLSEALGIAPPCGSCGCQDRMPLDTSLSPRKALSDLSRVKIRMDRERQMNAFKNMLLNAQHIRNLEAGRSETEPMSHPSSSRTVSSDDSAEMKSCDWAEMVGDGTAPMKDQITANNPESSSGQERSTTNPQGNLLVRPYSQMSDDKAKHQCAKVMPNHSRTRRKLPAPPCGVQALELQTNSGIPVARQRVSSREKDVRKVRMLPKTPEEDPAPVTGWQRIQQQIESMSQEPVDVLSLYICYKDMLRRSKLDPDNASRRIASSRQLPHQEPMTSYDSQAASSAKPKMTAAQHYAYLESRLAAGNRKLQRRNRRRHSSYMERRTCSPILEHPAESYFPPYSSLPYGQSRDIKGSPEPWTDELLPRPRTSRQMGILEKRLRNMTV